MNIHEAAIEILHSAAIPSLGSAGLCYALQAQMRLRQGNVSDSAYLQMHDLTISREGAYPHSDYYLGERGQWTEARLNTIILLAITTPEDFI
jgi:hypothetical protein